MTLCFAIVGLGLTSCYSDPKVVNDPGRPLVLPPEAYYAEGIHDRTAVPPMVGVSGSIVIAGQMPIPASGATVSLLIVQPDGSKKKVGEMTTGPDGRFEFSQKLQKGNYLLKVDGRRFAGEKTINFLDKPREDILLEVTQKRRAAQ